MHAQPLTFPEIRPANYAPLTEEPRYDPARHLKLEPPERVWSLAEFGYGADEIAACASPVAVTAPFRMLSDEGLAALRQVVLALQDQRTVLAGNRVPSHLAGGVYRSAFLRDFCNCPVIAGFLSDLAGTPLAPHSMPSQQLYVNFTPDDITKAVDSWHFDGIGFDYVLMLSDPGALKGGRFEFFRGTRAEAAELIGTDVRRLRRGHTTPLPAERVESVVFPAAGYGIFQQGSLVVHRASRLESLAERITVVPGYVSLDLAAADPTAFWDMPHYHEPGIVSELTRHAAWLGQARLAALIERLPDGGDPAACAAALRQALAEVTAITAELESVAAGKMRD